MADRVVAKHLEEDLHVEHVYVVNSSTCRSTVTILLFCVLVFHWFLFGLCDSSLSYGSILVSRYCHYSFINITGMLLAEPICPFSL